MIQPPFPDDALFRNHPWYGRLHHREAGGFRNIWGSPREEPGLQAIKWMLQRAFRSAPTDAAPVSPPDATLLATPPSMLRATWLGHSAVLLQFPSLTVLIDPMFGRRASPFAFAGPDRKAPLPLAVEALPRPDIVLLSHDHYDHLDSGSVRLVEELFAPLWLVPLGVAKFMRQLGVRRVAEADWWQFADLPGLRVHATPAKHFSGRALHNRDGTLWCGWYLQVEGGPSVYYSGDTAYAAHLGEIGERLGAPDLAVLPIGAYDPRWFMEPVHMNPEEAVQAFEDLGARAFLPVHWGTFDLADESLSAPVERLRSAMHAAGHADNLHVLSIGGVYEPVV